MRLSLGLGLNKGGSRLPRFITDIFNILQSSPTYTGGPLTATDYEGNLVTSPAGTPALEGGRLATTVAEGAMLGPELLLPLNFSSWSDSGGVASKSADTFTTTSAGGVRIDSSILASKRYLFQVSGTTTDADMTLRSYNSISSYGQKLGGGEFTFSGEITVPNSGLYFRNNGAATTDISSFSIREVIPTWLDTELDGTPIQPSISTPTRSGTKRWYQEPFASPFGYSNWPARTNKVTCRKFNPVDTTNITKSGAATAVLSVIDDSVLLAKLENNLVFVGDSITNHYGIAAEDGFASLVAAENTTKTNLGVNSAEIYDETATYKSWIDDAAEVDNTLTTNKNILVVLLGTNDITHAPGKSAVDTHTDLQTFCQARKSAGWIVIVCTNLDRQTVGATINDYNELIRLNYATYANFMCDFRVDDRLSDYSNGSYFIDSVHPNEAGHAIMSELLSPSISSALGLGENLSLICTTGKVYEIDNTNDLAVAAYANISGLTGNTNIHALSIYTRKVVGTGGTLRKLKASASQVAFNTTYYAKVKLVDVVAVDDQLTIRCDAGSKIRFILPQLEEGAFATPPIFDPLNDSLTSITRAATNLTLPTAGILPVNDFGIWGEVIPGASGQPSFAMFFCSYVDPTNDVRVTQPTTGAQIRFEKKINNTSHALFDLYAPAKDAPFQYQAFQSRVYGMGIRVKQQGGAWSAWTLKDDADGRLDATIASTYQVGARNNASHFAGYYPGLAVIQHADPKAYLETLTLKYGA
jgi:lysophospholipase L1-like esterase